MTTATDQTTLSEPRAFEWWMTSNFALGVSFSAFVSLLIPPFVNEVTGEASASGVVMAIISLGAILGPAFGSFADRYRAHRLVMVGGVAGMSLAFVAYGLSAEIPELYVLDAVLMGLSIAAVSAASPVFIVGAGLSKEMEAKQMTIFQLMMPAGQLAGGVLLAALTSWTFAQRFWLGAGIAGLCFLVVFFNSAGVDRRLQSHIDATQVSDTIEIQKASLRQVFLSMFGVFILVLTLASIANNGINNQISNIMPNVYGIDEKSTAALISLAGLLNIVLFFPAGRWMGRSGAFGPFAAGIAARFVGALGMGLVGLMTDSPVLLGAAFMQVLYQSNPFARLAQSSLAVRFASFPAGAASGWVIAASAFGSFIGSVVGGFLADEFGFNSIAWMAAGAAGAAMALVLFVLLPANKRVIDAEEPSRADLTPEAPPSA